MNVFSYLCQLFVQTIQDFFIDIEERFRLEKRIVQAIAQGSTDEITRILNDYNNDILLSFFNRIPHSPIRSAKNIMLVMNTIFRIAKVLYVTPSHLSRKFKAETNVNIIDFINNKRVDEAKYYLQTGNASITDIAIMVGFNDLNYFSRTFKKITTFSPSQYRAHYHTSHKEAGK